MYSRINHHGDPYLVTTPSFRILANLSVLKGSSPSADTSATADGGCKLLTMTWMGNRGGTPELSVRFICTRLCTDTHKR